MSVPSLKASKFAIRSQSDASLASDAELHFHDAWASREAADRLTRALSGKARK